jgi:hypothetical protein
MNTGKRELWEKRIRDYEASGLNGKRWCKGKEIEGTPCPKRGSIHYYLS